MWSAVLIGSLIVGGCSVGNADSSVSKKGAAPTSEAAAEPTAPPDQPESPDTHQLIALLHGLGDEFAFEHRGSSLLTVRRTQR